MRSILLDIIPRRFRRRSYLVSGTIFLRALLNFAGLALLIPVLLLILDSESMHTNPWLERLYQAGRFESDRAFALTVCGCIVALIAFKNLLNLFLLRYERRYIYDLYRCMSRRLYIEYHDRGLGFIKNTNSALLSRNVNFVCLAFVTGILVPLASITSESMLLALLFTALLFYNLYSVSLSTNFSKAFASPPATDECIAPRYFMHLTRRLPKIFSPRNRRTMYTPRLTMKYTV